MDEKAKEKKQMSMNDFIVQRIIGEGAYGRAVLCKSKSDNSLVVIKEITLTNLTEEEQRNAWKETKVLSVLHHPYIISYYGCFMEQNILRIVMEYADNGDLGEKIKKANTQHFDEETILGWFVQICLALKHLHDRKILHRDLKCQNIFLMKDGTSKLGDFGIAKMLDTTTQLSQTAIGTPYYLSPEICQGKPYDKKSDIWSLGCILYELCNLRHPFESNCLNGLIIKIQRAKPAPIPYYYSPNLRKLVDQLLQKVPSKRPTIHQILDLDFIRSRIPNFLSRTIGKEELGHTTFHGLKAGESPEKREVPEETNEENPEASENKNEKNHVKKFEKSLEKPNRRKDILRPPKLKQRIRSSAQIIKYSHNNQKKTDSMKSNAEILQAQKSALVLAERAIVKEQKAKREEEERLIRQKNEERRQEIIERAKQKEAERKEKMRKLKQEAREQQEKYHQLKPTFHVHRSKPPKPNKENADDTPEKPRKPLSEEQIKEEAREKVKEHLREYVKEHRKGSIKEDIQKGKAESKNRKYEEKSIEPVKNNEEIGPRRSKRHEHNELRKFLAQKRAELKNKKETDDIIFIGNMEISLKDEINESDKNDVIEITQKKSELENLYAAHEANSTSAVYHIENCPSKELKQLVFALCNERSSSDENQNDNSIFPPEKKTPEAQSPIKTMMKKIDQLLESSSSSDDEFAFQTEEEEKVDEIELLVSDNSSDQLDSSTLNASSNNDDLSQNESCLEDNYAYSNINKSDIYDTSCENLNESDVTTSTNDSYIHNENRNELVNGHSFEKIDNERKEIDTFPKGGANESSKTITEDDETTLVDNLTSENAISENERTEDETENRLENEIEKEERKNETEKEDEVENENEVEKGDEIEKEDEIEHENDVENENDAEKNLEFCDQDILEREISLENEFIDDNSIDLLDSESGDQIVIAHNENYEDKIQILENCIKDQNCILSRDNQSIIINHQPDHLEFHFKGKELKLDTLSKYDSMSYKIEAIRQFIENGLGLDIFIEAYHIIQSKDDSSIDRVLSTPEQKSYYTLIKQLIACEEQLNGICYS